MSINKSTKKRSNFIDYDYENFYDEPIISLEKKKSIYVTKTIRAGDIFEVEIYPGFTKKEFDAFKPRTKPTRKAQMNLNNKNAQKRFIRLMNANFDFDDYIMHLTYSNDKLPGSIEEAEKEVYKLIRKINYRRKKDGLKNAKWMYVTEYDKDKKIRVHHHLIIEKGIDRKVMKDLWTNGKRTKVEELEPDEFGLTGLGKYLTKDPKGKKRWKSSKYLKQPIEKKSYSSFSNKKIWGMVDDDTKVSLYLNKRYRSKKYLNHQIRYNSYNKMYYIYVQMRTKERMNI